MQETAKTLRNELTRKTLFFGYFVKCEFEVLRKATAKLEIIRSRCLCSRLEPGGRPNTN
jgi:hypothetical protein